MIDPTLVVLDEEEQLYSDAIARGDFVVMQGKDAEIFKKNIIMAAHNYLNNPITFSSSDKKDIITYLDNL